MQELKIERTESQMQEPKFERTEIAQCAGCVAMMLMGGAYDFSLVSFPCGATWTGVLV